MRKKRKKSSKRQGLVVLGSGEENSRVLLGDADQESEARMSKNALRTGRRQAVDVLFCIHPSIPFFTRDWFKHSWLATDDSTHILLKDIKEDSSRRFTSVHDGPNRCLPRAHFNDRGARDAARETRRIGICRSAGTSPCLHHLSGTQHETSFCLALHRQLVPKKTLVDNFKRAIMEAKHVNEFRPDDVLWEKISKELLRNPDRPLKNTERGWCTFITTCFL
ncbi:hypothetical protein TNCV_1177071 [Trichonephila clavipes]|nr:hypothetical protein TNCV_1177071 [Trichonephila clavipes]